ncbi:sulfatase family protein [Alienimonas chondri]|uniref:Multifunctional alkaline phosphatase superfamily protein n=1 Tax=Alienimonas chondri TaxID=2681879 RepID=A0ABX1VDI4_9PLAN|nr:sulfatase [Alienimonas chondri]NNJ25580.1 Multifunctional alkaline phosphatase superfamily protein [Alienimonas chondri]
MSARFAHPRSARSLTFRPLVSAIAFAIAAPFAAAAQPDAAAEKPTTQRPNVVFIFSDDHATQAISAYGSKINVTPNIDRIGAEGMRFDRCYCTNSICGPSRAVILTGKHSHLNGFRQNGNRFDGSQQTFPKLLQQVGYQTALIGKWHLGSDPTGFDYSDVLRGQGHYYNTPFSKNGGPFEVQEGYVTDVITQKTLTWLKGEDGARDTTKPFFLMFQHKAPHRRWEPGPKHLTMYDDVEIPAPDSLFDDYDGYPGRSDAARHQDMTISQTMTLHDLKLTGPDGRLNDEQKAAWNAAYEPKNEAFREANLTGKDLVRWKYQRYIKDYLRCVAGVDDAIGEVMDYLEESGLDENTIVIYSSDQGFYLGEHGWFDKRFMYEESYKMPFLVKWPGVTKPGSVDKHLVSNLDFAETFLDIAGAEIPDDMQGVSLVPLLEGENPPDWRDALYYHYYEFNPDRRTVHAVRRHNGVQTDRYKLIHFYNIDQYELFDLEKDPQEMNSVADDPAYADVLRGLKVKLDQLQEQYEVPDDSGSAPAMPDWLKQDLQKKAEQRLEETQTDTKAAT